MHPDDPTVRNAPTWNAAPPHPQPPQRNWMWLVVAATVMIVVASAVTIVVAKSGDDDSAAATSTSSSSSKAGTTKASVPKSTTPTSTAAPGPPPPITALALGDVLLSAPEAAEAFGIPSAHESSVRLDPISGTSEIPDACVSLWAPIHKETYEPTGYTAIARKNLRDEPQDDNYMTEAAVAYADPQAANAAVQHVVAAWRGCEALEFRSGYGDPYTLKSASVDESGGVFSIQLFAKSYLDDPVNSTDLNCQRAITSRRNVVADVIACAPPVGTFAATMAADMAAKIDAAP